jgi:hypothetical protein
MLTAEDLTILRAVREAYKHDHNIVTVFEIIDRLIAPRRRS